MSYRVRVINNNGKQMQIFGNNDLPEIVKAEFLKQGAVFNEADEFRLVVKDVMGIINAIENYIKEESARFLKNKTIYDKKTEEMNEHYGNNSVKSNSIFDFTNDFVPSRENSELGYDGMPIWLILDCYIPSYIAFESYNFIKHISDSLERDGLYAWKLKEGEEIIIEGW